MRQQSFDYEAAKAAGYADDEINDYLSASSKPQSKKQSAGFDREAALSAGYSEEEIDDYLSQSKPKKQKSIANKAGRLAGQYALGAAENIALPYELAVAPLASKESQVVAYREHLFDDLENMEMQKQTGVWSAEDQAHYENVLDQIKNPEKAEQFVQTADLGVRGLAEKATGADLHPEGFLEKAASWSGFIKNPKNLANLAKSGLSRSEVIKAISPTGSDVARGLGAGAGLQAAEEGQFGPIGTIAAAVVGDLAGIGSAKAAKGVVSLVKSPKEFLAKKAAKLTSPEKLAVQKEIIKDFRDAGIQADLGSLTDSNLVKWTQSRIAQSGLTGKALDEFKDQITSQIKNEYKALAEGLGEARFATMHEAGDVAREGIKKIRDSDLSATRQLYQNAEAALKDNAYVAPHRLATAIEKLEKQLKPGSIKSGEQSSVLSALEKLKRDLYDSNGGLMYANVKELMNNKIALNDIINYEVQGGAKQLLKGIVSELDRAIISYGKENPGFAKNYISANRKFAEHAKTFRNKNVNQMLQAADPAQIMNKMNSVQGIRDLGKVLNKTAEGKEIFNSLKRAKLDKVIGDNLVDSTTQQVKLGTFSNLLKKGKNAEIIKEVLGPKEFKRLEKLQKNAGRLADAAQKFYNASKSGVVAVDAAAIMQGVNSLVNLLHGNPWPLLKIGGGVAGARSIGKLLADPEFLKLAEEAILASEKGSEAELVQIFEQMRPYLLQGKEEMKED